MLETLVKVLPAKWQPRAKGITVALGTLLGILTLVLPDTPPWLTAAVMVATALGVYNVPAVGYQFVSGHWGGIEAPKKPQP